ncbi:MAG: hypothetical protein COA68_17750 [Oceanobacter sp.]|nr:MAG: hypothetical protein COA68_17750 [Oceanobacter sp.]
MAAASRDTVAAVIAGGDVRGCLTDREIDSALRRLFPIAPLVPSALFFFWAKGLITPETVRDQLRRVWTQTANTTLLCVAHFRHHWVCMRIHGDLNLDSTSKVEVWDSAPSPMVQRDIRRLTKALGWPEAHFLPSPRQTRMSEECGLFALANYSLLAEGITPPDIGTVSLSPLRQLLTLSGRELETQLALDFHNQFMTLVRTAYGIAPIQVASAPWRHDPYGVDTIRIARCPHDHAAGGNTDTPKCCARKQQKRGGAFCTENAITTAGVPLCRLHLLSSNTGDAKCTATSKTSGKPCSHKAVADLETCPFHTPDDIFKQWLSSYESRMATMPPDAPEPPLTDATSDQPLVDAPLVDALAQLNDPDLEDELFSIADFAQPMPPTNTGGDETAPPRTLGQLLARLRLAADESQAHPLALLAWEKQTIAGHNRALRYLTTSPAARALAGHNLATGLLEVFWRRRTERKWTWATLLRNLAEMQGALKNLPISRGIPAIQLGDNVEWLAALKAVAARARSERPRTPRAATAQQIEAALRREPNRATRSLLAMTWLLCGRTGDCRRLQPADVLVNSESQTLTITFRAGKTVARRGPYSLHTSMPPSWLNLLGIDDLANTADWVPLLQMATVPEVLLALRRADPTLENRSIRRGSLQTLALSGVEESTLLDFSGHTNVSTLRRYLGWGSIGTVKHDKMVAASAGLAPPTIEGGGPPAPTRRRESEQPGRVDTTTKSLSDHTASDERWLHFLGAEAPPLSALPLQTEIREHLDPASLPLASKDVAGSINLDKVMEQLQDVDPELATLATESLRWLWDPAKYKEELLPLPNEKGGHLMYRCRRNATCKLSDTDIETQRTLQKYETREESRALHAEMMDWCRVFTVPEYFKVPPRRRHIAEPLINDRFFRTPTIHFRSRAQRHTTIASHAGGWAATLDLASFFDQLLLQPGVRHHFGLRFADGSHSRMRVLPMGFRPAAQVAQCVCWLLVSGLEERFSVEIMTYIDNILVLGASAAAVRAATAAILERAQQWGAIFNEEDAEPTQQFEFLGESFDLSGEQPMTTLSKKTLDKLNSIRPLAASPMTRRELAALVGLCLFADGSGLPANNIYLHYSALRFYREQMTVPRDADRHTWDRHIGVIPPNVLADFDAWLERLRSNIPRTVYSPSDPKPPTDILFVDASEIGWGAIHIDVATGTARPYSADWTSTERDKFNLGSSVAAEPLGITNAICRCISAGTHRRVVIYTDHDPIVGALNASCAKAYTYWRLQKLTRSLPNTSVEVRHIPGVINPADAFSRGIGNCGDERWRIIMAQATKHHDDHEEDGEHGTDTSHAAPEWRATARNPYRGLFVSYG